MPNLQKPNLGGKRPAVEKIERDDPAARMWRAFYDEQQDIIAIENAIGEERARKFDEMMETYYSDRAREKQRREYARAKRKRDAMVETYLNNDRNMDIVNRVRELVRDAGKDVIDLIEYRRELATKKKKRQDRRDRLGIL